MPPIWGVLADKLLIWLDYTDYKGCAIFLFDTLLYIPIFYYCPYKDMSNYWLRFILLFLLGITLICINFFFYVLFRLFFWFISFWFKGDLLLCMWRSLILLEASVNMSSLIFNSAIENILLLLFVFGLFLIEMVFDATIECFCVSNSLGGTPPNVVTNGWAPDSLTVLGIFEVKSSSEEL